MSTKRPSRHRFPGRIFGICVLGVALLGSFVAGTRVDPLRALRSKSRPAEEPALPSLDELFPPVEHLPTDTWKVSRRPAGPRSQEPRAVRERAEAIRRDAAAIADECQRAAGGDWEKWQQDTAPYRTALKTRITDLQGSSLSSLDGFALSEIAPGTNLVHLWHPNRIDLFRRDRPVVAADRWLQQRGIDLIFVPVPKMAETYIEHFLDPCPADGIIAPRVRQTLFELLRDEVEVVDANRILRQFRNSAEELLYPPGDTHWGPRGMRIIAAEVANRIERYRFGAGARYAPPVVTVSPTAFPRNGRLTEWAILSPESKEQPLQLQLSDIVERCKLMNAMLPDDPKSPVLIIGHSYTRGFHDMLVKELNLLVNTIMHEGGTSEFFLDFLRQPELIAHCRVIVWISTDLHLTNFKEMPAPVKKAL